MAPAVLRLLLEQREQRAQCGGAVANQVQLHRIAQAGQRAVNVDLHAARTARLWQELAVRERRANHQQRVAVLHHVPRGFGAEEADAAGDKGEIVGHRRLAEQRFGDAGLQRLGDGNNLVRSGERAGADQHGNLAAGIEYGGRLAQQFVLRQKRGAGVADAGVCRAVRHRWVLIRHQLQIVRQDHASYRATAARNAHGAVDQVSHLRRNAGSGHEVGSHILEQGLQIDLLLVVRADGGACLLPDDGDNRHVIHLRVVQPGQQMDCARAGGCVAEADLAGEFGVTRGHEGSHLLVAHLHIMHGVPLPVRALHRGRQRHHPDSHRPG